jgi:hypothetical protein
MKEPVKCIDTYVKSKCFSCATEIIKELEVPYCTYLCFWIAIEKPKGKPFPPRSFK